eukprot:TRINITY_DN110494_c0_g1_i1.p1 TRINITY_DN110494_c0_g1~~TRINITY_DN110494_c0_g1_i1.p1  ORF type:complete len:337 (-),score=47.49 TRINITY_DN110494_c0_g1_i1:33-1043(-)
MARASNLFLCLAFATLLSGAAAESRSEDCKDQRADRDQREQGQILLQVAKERKLISAMQDGPSRGAPVIFQAFTDATNLTNSDIFSKEYVENMFKDGIEDQYWQASALLMKEYATRHDYNYVMWSFTQGRYGCMHPTLGPQPTHWCKSVALEHTMKAFPDSDTFVYLDADVYIRNMSQKIHEYVKTAERCPGSRKPENATIISWRNVAEWGNCNEKSAGTVIFQRKAHLPRLINAWRAAHRPGPWPWGDYDQHAFNQVNSSEIAIISDEIYKSNSKFLLHRCAGCTWMEPRMELAKKFFLENEVNVDDLMDGLSNAKEWVQRFPGYEKVPIEGVSY